MNKSSYCYRFDTVDDNERITRVMHEALTGKSSPWLWTVFPEMLKIKNVNWLIQVLLNVRELDMVTQGWPFLFWVQISKAKLNGEARVSTRRWISLLMFSVGNLWIQINVAEMFQIFSINFQVPKLNHPAEPLNLITIDDNLTKRDLFFCLFAAMAWRGEYKKSSISVNFSN